MKKTTLTSMTAVEKKFVREFTESCLQPQGVNRKLWPELKKDALERFRRVQKARCATMADDAVTAFVESVCPIMTTKEKK